MGKQWKQWQTLFSAAKSPLIVTAAMKLKNTPWKKSYDQPRQPIKKQRHYFANKGPSSQSCDILVSHIWMWEWDHKEGWVLKNWGFELWYWRRCLRVPWTARRSNQSILKEINPEHSLEAETPILWPPDAKIWLIRKGPNAGKDWRQEEKGMTEDKMVGQHH